MLSISQFCAFGNKKALNILRIHYPGIFPTDATMNCHLVYTPINYFNPLLITKVSYLISDKIVLLKHF